MHNSKVEKHEDGGFVLTITVAADDVKKTKDAVIEDLVKHVSLPGFRKGKAPYAQAVAKLPADLINEEILKKILPDAYNKAIEEQKLHPIISPKLHIKSFEDGKDLEFTAETCQMPEVTLKNYKDEVKKITASSKILVPGKETKKPSMDEILNTVLRNADVQIPAILVEQETNRLLSNMLDELKTLGLSLDQYLQSRGKTADELKKEYDEKARQDIKLEFVLKKIADTERIVVEQKDIDETITKISDPKQKDSVKANPYLLASIIRQQKTLDFLSKI